MRYAQGGGLTAERREFREGLRLKAAERFARGETNAVIARDLRVSVRSVQRWRRTWREGSPRSGLDWLGIPAQTQRGPVRTAGSRAGERVQWLTAGRTSGGRCRGSRRCSAGVSTRPTRSRASPGCCGGMAGRVRCRPGGRWNATTRRSRDGRGRRGRRWKDRGGARRLDRLRGRGRSVPSAGLVTVSPEVAAAMSVSPELWQASSLSSHDCRAPGGCVRRTRPRTTPNRVSKLPPSSSVV